jgi:hypothetical protein
MSPPKKGENMFKKLNVSALCACLGFGIALAQAPSSQPTAPELVDKPRVFITDSQSWEIAGHAGGANGAFGAETHGGARPQTAEIIKTFGERCQDVVTNNQQNKANYIVVLDHEGGKGFLRHRNKVAVFDAQSGDSVISKSTLSLGGSVEDACNGIRQHWATHSHPAQPVLASTAKPDAAASTAEAKRAGTKLSVNSTPEGADIEVDGNFVGNTPSILELAAGDHTVSVKKAGFKTWEKTIKISGGDVTLKAELEKTEVSSN